MSSAWRRIVDNTPPLWTFIESSVPPDIVDIALKRSEASLLSIRVRRNAFATASSFMQKVVPHVGRWKVADLSDTACEYLPRTPAPRLQEIALIGDHDMVSNPEILRGELPSLQRLTLDHVHFTGPLPSFGRNLRFLTIRQSRSTDRDITYTEIHRLLLLHLNLVEVELGASRWSEALPNPEILEDVRLPSLRRFSLLGLGYDGLASLPLLQKITAPNCSSFEFGTHHLPEKSLDLLQAVEPYFASVVATTSKDLKLSITNDTEFELAIGRGESKFKLSTRSPRPGLELAWVVDMLTRYHPNVTYLKLLTRSTPSHDELSKLFMVLTAVTEFHVGSILEVWDMLGRPAAAVVERGPAQWFLQALEKLAVVDRQGIGDQRLFAAIRAREAAATEMDSTGSLAEHRPVRLKQVEYRAPPWVPGDRRWSELLGDRFVLECLKMF